MKSLLFTLTLLSTTTLFAQGQNSRKCVDFSNGPVLNTSITTAVMEIDGSSCNSQGDCRDHYSVGYYHTIQYELKLAPSDILSATSETICIHQGWPRGLTSSKASETTFIYSQKFENLRSERKLKVTKANMELFAIKKADYKKLSEIKSTSLKDDVLRFTTAADSRFENVLLLRNTSVLNQGVNEIITLTKENTTTTTLQDGTHSHEVRLIDLDSKIRKKYKVELVRRLIGGLAITSAPEATSNFSFFYKF